MPMRVEDIAHEALALPVAARALLADRLVESLDPAEGSELHDAWVVEANQRLEDLRTGRVKGIAAEDAVAWVRKTLDDGRTSS